MLILLKNHKNKCQLWGFDAYYFIHLMKNWYLLINFYVFVNSIWLFGFLIKIKLKLCLSIFYVLYYQILFSYFWNLSYGTHRIRIIIADSLWGQQTTKQNQKIQGVSCQ